MKKVISIVLGFFFLGLFSALSAADFKPTYNSSTKQLSVSHNNTNGMYYYYGAYNYNDGTRYYNSSSRRSSNWLVNATPGKYYISATVRTSSGQYLRSYGRYDLGLESVTPIVDKGFEVIEGTNSNDITIKHLTDNSSYYYMYLYNYNTRERFYNPTNVRNTNSYTFNNLPSGKYYVSVMIRNHLGQYLRTTKYINIVDPKAEPIVDKGFEIDYNGDKGTLTLNHLTKNSKYYYYYLYNYNDGSRYYTTSPTTQGSSFTVSAKPGKYYVVTIIKNELGQYLRNTKRVDVALDLLEPIIDKGVSYEYNSSDKVLTLTHNTDNSSYYYFYVNGYTVEGKYVYYTRSSTEYKNREFVIKGVQPGDYNVTTMIKDHLGQYKKNTKKIKIENPFDIKPLGIQIDKTNKKMSISDSSTGTFTSVSLNITKTNIEGVSNTSDQAYPTTTLPLTAPISISYEDGLSKMSISVNYQYVDNGNNVTKTNTYTYYMTDLYNINIVDPITTVNTTDKTIQIVDKTIGQFISATAVYSQVTTAGTVSNETIEYKNVMNGDIDYTKDYADNLMQVTINTTYKYTQLGNETIKKTTKTIKSDELYTTQVTEPENPSLTPEEQKIFDNATAVQMVQYGNTIKLKAAYDQGYSGKGVLVGVVEGNFGLDFADSINDKIVNKDDIVAGTVSSGDTRHMNHVASSITGDPLKGWTKGVAYGADLALFNGFTNGLTAAYNYNVANDKDISVLNNSWGAAGTYSADTVRNFADYYTNSSNIASQVEYQLLKQGTSLIKAAGNDGLAGCDTTGTNTCEPYSLKWTYIMDKYGDELDGGVMIVGSYDQNNGTLYSYSNKAGDLMKDYYIVAPGAYYAETGSGAGIVTIDANGNVAVPTNVEYLSGTSMAAPIVTGAYALLREKHPNVTGQTITKILFDTATDLGAAGVDDVYGHGLLNLEAAFNPVGTLSVADTSSSTLREGRELSTPTEFISTSGIISNKLQNISMPIIDGYGRLFNQKIQTR